MDDLAPAELDRLLTIDEVAAYLGIAKNTMYRWRVDGAGPVAIKMGKHLRFRRAAVELWLDEHTEGEAPPPLPAVDDVVAEVARATEGKPVC